MIKNKYYIGQRVRTQEGNDFEIGRIKSESGEIMYAGSAFDFFHFEYNLEPVPEKKKIVLWQWIYKTPRGHYMEEWATEEVYCKAADYIKTGASKEIEI